MKPYIDKTYYFNTKTKIVNSNPNNLSIYDICLDRQIFFNDIHTKLPDLLIHSAFMDGTIKYIEPGTFCINEQDHKCTFIKSLSLLNYDPINLCIVGIELYKKDNNNFYIVIMDNKDKSTVDNLPKKDCMSFIKGTITDIGWKHKSILLDMYNYIDNSTIVDNYFGEPTNYSDEYFN